MAFIRSSEHAVGALRGAMDEIADVELDALEVGEASDLLVELAAMTNRLGGELARVAAHVSDSDEWKASGASSMAAYLSNETGMAWGQARAAVELGAAFVDTPALGDAVRAGDLSPHAAAKILPAVGDDGFDDVSNKLIDEVAGLTPTKAEQHIEQWRAVTNPVDDDQRRQKANDERSITFRSIGDGMTHIEGTVPNRIANSLRRSLKHLADQQRRDESERTTEQRRVDALGDLSAAYERGEVTGGRNLPRIIATMTLNDLETRSGIATDSLGQTLTSADIDQLCCDAVIHRYVADQNGAVLNFGRGKRTATPQQFLALTARDQGCRHPGCDRPPEWCEAHHLREFVARGGLTNLDELVLLCHHHHHALHDDGWTLAGDVTNLVFTGPDGRRLHSPIPRHAHRPAA